MFPVDTFFLISNICSQTNRRGPPENYRDEPYYPRKEINTALATGKAEPMAVAEAKVPTKNVAGPPVYYPPGQEMFSKSEQSAAAWRAQVTVVFFVHHSTKALMFPFYHNIGRICEGKWQI